MSDVGRIQKIFGSLQVKTLRKFTSTKILKVKIFLNFYQNTLKKTKSVRDQTLMRCMSMLLLVYLDNCLKLKAMKISAEQQRVMNLPISSPFPPLVVQSVQIPAAFAIFQHNYSVFYAGSVNLSVNFILSFIPDVLFVPSQCCTGPWP